MSIQFNTDEQQNLELGGWGYDLDCRVMHKFSLSKNVQYTLKKEFSEEDENVFILKKEDSRKSNEFETLHQFNKFWKEKIKY